MNITILRVSILVVCVCLTSCVGLPTKEVDRPPSGTGFGLVVYWSGAVHKHRRIELHHWQDNKKDTLIWPNLTMKWVIKDNDDLALFFGWLNRGPSVHSKVGFEMFAVEKKGPAVNITDDLVHRYVRGIAANAETALRDYSVSAFEEKDNRFVFTISEIGKHDGTIVLTRNEVMNLIHEIKERGQLLKDPVYDTPYYQRN